MVSAAISDLFFNHTHRNLDEALAARGKDEDGLDWSIGKPLHNAIHWDAADFSNLLFAAFGVHVDAGELARDYIRRL